MNCSETGKTLIRDIAALFSCSPQGDYFRIRTPFLYPDCDVIDLFCKPEGDFMLVSDLGETTGWLWMNAVGEPRTAQQEALISGACRTHGVKYHQNAILAQCDSEDMLAEAVMRVGQACVRVSDLLYTFRALEGSLEVLDKDTILGS